MKSPAKVCKPSFQFEESIDGPVFGLDEVGRGPLAGPVVAACVYIPRASYTLPFIPEIRDSKTLSKTKLQSLYAEITRHCEWRVAEIAPAEIDEINILQASLKAMVMAAQAMTRTPVHALVDGHRLPKNLPCAATPVIKGDAKSVSIAAASIIAKVTRDRLMERLHEEHPYYGWDRNAGYPTKAHLEGISTHGITPHHRKSFAPVKNFLEQNPDSLSTRTPCFSAA